MAWDGTFLYVTRYDESGYTMLRTTLAPGPVESIAMGSGRVAGIAADGQALYWLEGTDQSIHQGRLLVVAW